jgi:hypothetical protein
MAPAGIVPKPAGPVKQKSVIKKQKQAKQRISSAGGILAIVIAARRHFA